MKECSSPSDAEKLVELLKRNQGEDTMKYRPSRELLDAMISQNEITIMLFSESKDELVQKTIERLRAEIKRWSEDYDQQALRTG